MDDDVDTHTHIHGFNAYATVTHAHTLSQTTVVLMTTFAHSLSLFGDSVCSLSLTYSAPSRPPVLLYLRLLHCIMFCVELIREFGSTASPDFALPLSLSTAHDFGSGYVFVFFLGV